jgi:hypothetical protein
VLRLSACQICGRKLYTFLKVRMYATTNQSCLTAHVRVAIVNVTDAEGYVRVANTLVLVMNI